MDLLALNNYLEMFAIAFISPFVYLGYFYPVVVTTTALIANFYCGVKLNSLKSSLYTWWIAVYCYLVELFALVLHSVVQATPLFSHNVRRLETLISLITQSLTDTFGLPGVFKITFAASTRPTVVVSRLTVLLGVVMGM